MIPECLGFPELFGDVTPDVFLDITTVHGSNSGRFVTHAGSDFLRNKVTKLRKAGQKTEGDHVVGLTPTHCLPEFENRLLAVAGQAFHRSSEKLRHTLGHMVPGIKGPRRVQIRLKNGGKMLDLFRPAHLVDVWADVADLRD